MTHILVLDDEESYTEVLKYNLMKEGYEVDVANSAEEALGYDLSKYQLMLVDIMMEDISGFDFVKRVRNNPQTQFTPVIFCSALNGEDDTVMGLNIGADDYITKPFTIGEVIARVRAVLRRAQARPQAQPAVPQMPAQPIMGINTPVMPQHPANYEPDIIFKGLRLDRNDKNCYVDGQPIALTRKEYDMLTFFLQHRERIHSRDEIMHQVWGSQEVTNRAVDTNITRLRQKLGAYGDHIVTRLGYGYGFKSEI